MQRLIDIYRELSRRKVTRVAAGYVLILWALTLGFAELFPVFGLGDWAVRGFIVAGLACLPVVVLFAWKYNLTSAGVMRDPMDFPEAPLTPGKIRDWGVCRQDGATPVPLVANWQDAEQREQQQCYSETVLIGRDASNDICISDPRISRMHAVAWFEPTGWRLRDLGSSNGSFLNGERLAEAMRMPAICELRMHPKGPVVRLQTVDEDRTLLTLHGNERNTSGEDQ